MNTWILSGLLPFSDYVVRGRTNILGSTVSPNRAHPYRAPRNEQFDLVISNPPFSLKMPPDEKKVVKTAFDLMASARSEAIFVERWYQLLRDGGLFCCVLPEAILDTSQNQDVRLFLVRYFRIRAVVSLPYDSFRPFTSSKTCIVLAEKRPAADAQKWAASWKRASVAGATVEQILAATLKDLGWDNEGIFMAEPANVGYKRRKNLPDLSRPNELYRDDGNGQVAGVDMTHPTTVLDYFRAGPTVPPSASRGFWVGLGAVATRAGFRLDPKYRWLWDFQKGLAHGDRSKAVQLRTLLEIVDLPREPKGELPYEMPLIDLESVESRQAIVSSTPTVDIVGSEKVHLAGCDLAFAQLEPYLAKFMIRPEDALGSTEWVGFHLKDRTLDPVVMAYLLMLPDVCECYRRLQSGKRHARLEANEMLDLLIEMPEKAGVAALAKAITARRDQIFELRRSALRVRAEIDRLFERDM
jgi:type I restriction enzyme M protein